jgi:hypothetical protein
MTTNQTTALGLPRMYAGDPLDWYAPETPRIVHARYGGGAIVRAHVTRDGRFNGDILFDNGLKFRFRGFKLPDSDVEDIRAAFGRAI